MSALPHLGMAQTAPVTSHRTLISVRMSGNRTFGTTRTSRPQRTGNSYFWRTTGEEFFVELLGRTLPAVNTDEGVRAVIKSKPIEPEGVERYLE